MEIQASVFEGATTPEEAAQRFLGAVSSGLATVIAGKLDEVLQGAESLDVNPQISGWHGLIGGCVMNMQWQRPSLGAPVGQICAFAPLNKGQAAVMGGSVSIGISIGATF
ncbi:hypothetical protein [Marinobacter nauticus]|uniref:hypothetical protein n=1 Tax=Marinobacter nauticus TaxID=2743 RepID=UPI001C59C338|nr:hypothetical protein [Marinobacter nauticus]MBW3199152.1 hypothetical protein [Marinobacter nauticus]MBY6184562.1 hypothetical protein [Marinobacter nauticus]